MEKPEIEVVILPSNYEPKYLVEVFLDGKTYEIKEEIKKLGFRWINNRWKLLINPFKEDLSKRIREILGELSKVASVKIWSPSEKTLEEIIGWVLKNAEGWKSKYDLIREIFVKVLEKRGFTNTIEALKNYEVEVTYNMVKVKINNEVIKLPPEIKIIGYMKNFKGVYNELKQLGYRYDSILRCFKVRPKLIVK